MRSAHIKYVPKGKHILVMHDANIRFLMEYRIGFPMLGIYYHNADRL